MFPDFSQIRIFLRPGNTDMRKAINSLAVLVSEEMQENTLYPTPPWWAVAVDLNRIDGQRRTIASPTGSS